MPSAWINWALFADQEFFCLFWVEQFWILQCNLEISHFLKIWTLHELEAGHISTSSLSGTCMCFGVDVPSTHSSQHTFFVFCNLPVNVFRWSYSNTEVHNAFRVEAFFVKDKPCEKWEKKDYQAQSTEHCSKGRGAKGGRDFAIQPTSFCLSQSMKSKIKKKVRNSRN